MHADFHITHLMHASLAHEGEAPDDAEHVRGEANDGERGGIA